MRDGLLSGLRIAQELAWIGRDRLIADTIGHDTGTAAEIPRDVEAIDARWLGRALRGAFPDASVRSVERMGGHSGTTTRERVRVVYANAGGAAPETIFVKLTPSDLATQLFNGLMNLGRSEVEFYRQVRDAVPVLAPRAYFARAARRGPRFVLLLEDMAARGARFATVDEPVTLQQAQAVVRTLAKLHAAFWESPRLTSDLAWLRARETNRNLPIERFVSARSNAPAIAKYADDLSPEVRERAHLVHVQRDRLEDYWARGPRTLIHGDSHVGNMFFVGDEAGLLDWQVVQRGQGIRDVGYFLMNSLDIELRRAHERELIELWCETLREHGVPDADLVRDELWSRYRSQALYVWIASSVTAAMAGLQPRSVIRRALERADAALCDHDAFALLDQLA